MANAIDVANAWSGLGRQMFQGQANYEAGRMKSAEAAAKQSALEGHANLYNQQANKAQQEAAMLQQRRQYQTPEHADTLGATFAGLNGPQASEMAQFQKQGNWGMNPERELPIGQEGPPVPSMSKQQPAWYSPEVKQRYDMGRMAQLAQLGATGDTNGEQIAKSLAQFLGQAQSSGALQNGGVRGLNALEAARNGKLYDNTQRGILSQETGQEAVNSDWQKVQRSAAAENYAQAGNANASAALSRSKIGQPTINPDGSVTAPTGKPMPVGALKLQQEGLENLSIAANINPMLQRFTDDIDGGKLKLGPVSNLVSKGRNFSGASDEGSRNFASFQATIEKLRNDSLRLNKGVQTDGDAQRAWNELMANINDPGVVKQRIAEIQRINDKAVELHRMNINQVRRNYGNPDIDISGYKASQPAPQTSPAVSGVPVAAIEFLKANPNQANAFAAKYGREAADAVLGRGR